MITINLLPEHFRRKDRLPIAVFASILVGVLAVSSTAGYYFFLQFGALSQVQSEREQIESQLVNQQAQLKYHAALQTESADYEKREAKIKEIGASRLLWTKKIDQLADIVNAGEDAGRYTVWLKSLDADQVSDAKATVGGKLKAKGLSGSSNYANMANFYSDLEGTLFYRDFIAINNPAGRQVEPSKDLVPSQAWEFDLTMILRPSPDAIAKAAKKATPAPAPKK